jgi:hypothetical protein
LRLIKKEEIKVAWRMHYLCYLRWLSGTYDIQSVIDQMEMSQNGCLNIDGNNVDFSYTDYDCTNVLEDELVKIELYLFGEFRPKVGEFISAYRKFLERISLRENK